MPGVSSDIYNSLLQLTTGKYYGFLYRNDLDHQQIIAPFLFQGLERHEKVIYITGTHTEEYIIDLLKCYGCDPAPYLASGQMEFVPATVAYYTGGAFNLDNAIEMLCAGVAQSLNDGYDAVRTTGDITWILSTTPGASRFLKYEEQLRQRFPEKCLSLYQYDCRRCMPAMLLHVLHIHPALVIDTEVVTENVFYIPTAENQSAQNASATLRRQMDILIHRNQADRRNRQSEERIHLGLEGSNVGLWDINFETGEIDYIQNWAEMLGYEPTEKSLSYEAWTENLHPEDKSQVLATLQAHLRGETPRFEIMHRLQAKSGEWRWVLDRGRVVEHDRNGRARRFVGMHMDVTDQREAEERAAEHYALVETLIDSLPLPVFYKDVNGVFYGCNPACEKFFNATKEQIIGHTVFDFLPREMAELIHEKDNELISEGGFRIYESISGGVDTERHYIIHKSAYTRHDGSVRGLVSVVIDITQHEQDEERERAIRQLQESEQLRQQFLSFVSHELKTPLTSVLGAIEILRNQMIGPVNQQQLNALELAHRQGRRLHRLINDLLDIFQLESGRLPLNTKELSIPSLIDEAVSAYKHMAWERGIYLRAEHQTLDLNAEIDAKRFEQILDNLIEQAIDRTKQGGITISSRREDHQVVITLTDTGDALTQDETEQLFDDYNHFGINSHQGLALGMSLVKFIVEAHNGTIEVQNQAANTGSSFIITLPIAQPVAV